MTGLSLAPINACSVLQTKSFLHASSILSAIIWAVQLIARNLQHVSRCSESPHLLCSVLVFRPTSLNWASESADWLIPMGVCDLLLSPPEPGKKLCAQHFPKQHICLQCILESEPNTQDFGGIVQKSVPLSSCYALPRNIQSELGTFQSSAETWAIIEPFSGKSLFATKLNVSPHHFLGRPRVLQ